MDQPKTKPCMKNSNFNQLKRKKFLFYVLENNRSKIAKQCKHCTKLELIFNYYHTRF